MSLEQVDYRNSCFSVQRRRIILKTSVTRRTPAPIRI